MFFKKLIIIIGLCGLIMGCSTGAYYTDFSHDSTTQKGMRYLIGRGVSKDNSRAFSYFKQAALEENNALAQSELGYLYAAGKGVKRDAKQSFYWYQKAANQGLSSAQFNLGLLYLYGVGTPRDKNRGRDWIKKSAEHGFTPARQALGHL